MTDELQRRLDALAQRSPEGTKDLGSVLHGGGRIKRRRMLMSGVASVLVLAVGGAGAWALLSDPRYSTPTILSPAEDECESVDFDVAIYLRDDITDNERSQLLEMLDGEPVVENVREVSKAEAFEEFKRFYEDQPEFYESLPRDALPAFIEVTLTQAASEDDRRRLTAEVRELPGIDGARSADSLEESRREACEGTVIEPEWRVIDWPSTEVGAAVSCVDHYPEDLPKRDIAFDGTITATVTSDYDDNAGARPVTLYLYVNEVFRGDLRVGDEVAMSTWDFMLPDEDVSNVRILAAAGPTLDLMGCGFSRPYSEDDAARWRQTFQGSRPIDTGRTPKVVNVTCGDHRAAADTGIVQPTARGIKLRFAPVEGKVEFWLRRADDEGNNQQGRLLRDKAHVVFHSSGPGDFLVTCYPEGDPPDYREIEGQGYASFEVVDPLGSWVDPALECPLEEGGAFKVENTEPTTGPRRVVPRKPEVMLREHVPGILDGDDLVRPGYPKSQLRFEPRIVIREGDRIAVVYIVYSVDDWELKVSRCPAIDIGR